MPSISPWHIDLTATLTVSVATDVSRTFKVTVNNPCIESAYTSYVLPTDVVNFEYTVGQGNQTFDLATLFAQISVSPSMCGSITYTASTTTPNIADEDSNGYALTLAEDDNPLGTAIVTDFAACDQPFVTDPDVPFCFDAV